MVGATVISYSLSESLLLSTQLLDASAFHHVCPLRSIFLFLRRAAIVIACRRCEVPSNLVVPNLVLTRPVDQSMVGLYRCIQSFPNRNLSSCVATTAIRIFPLLTPVSTQACTFLVHPPLVLLPSALRMVFGKVFARVVNPILRTVSGLIVEIDDPESNIAIIGFRCTPPCESQIRNLGCLNVDRVVVHFLV